MELNMPFFIDTDGYSDRDRLLFTCGVEYRMLYDALTQGDRGPFNLHTENESRARMMCARLGLQCEISTTKLDEWRVLKII